MRQVRNAVKTGAVLITTPAAIKSLMLKFVENLTILTDCHHPRYAHPELRDETGVWADILHYFREGVCIMDEVDWVLHPLKSELKCARPGVPLVDASSQHE